MGRKAIGVHRHKVAPGMIPTKPLLQINLHHRHRRRISECPVECPIWTHPTNLGISRYSLHKPPHQRRRQHRQLPAHGVRPQVAQTIGVVAIRADGVHLLHLRPRLPHPLRRHLPQKHRTIIHGVHQQLKQADSPAVQTQHGAETQMAGDKAHRAEVKTQFRIVGQHHQRNHKPGAIRPETIQIPVPMPQCQRLQRQHLLPKLHQQRPAPGEIKEVPAAAGVR